MAANQNFDIASFWESLLIKITMPADTQQALDAAKKLDELESSGASTSDVAIASNEMWLKSASALMDVPEGIYPIAAKLAKITPISGTVIKHCPRCSSDF